MKLQKILFLSLSIVVGVAALPGSSEAFTPAQCRQKSAAFIKQLKAAVLLEKKVYKYPIRHKTPEQEEQFEAYYGEVRNLIAAYAPLSKACPNQMSSVNGTKLMRATLSSALNK